MGDQLLTYHFMRELLNLIWNKFYFEKRHEVLGNLLLDLRRGTAENLTGWRTANIGLKPPLTYTTKYLTRFLRGQRGKTLDQRHFSDKREQVRDYCI